MQNATFNRLLRFIPASQTSEILLGQPVDNQIDVGVSIREGREVLVAVYSGKSVLAPGIKTDRIEAVATLLSPLAQDEYVQHANEVKMAIPEIPTLFLKPEAALADPWPAPSIIPSCTVHEESADYEAELAIVIGRTAKNVSEAEAMGYVLGYTAANDISARQSQFSQSQWCFSKGFDGACPIGPVIASTEEIPDPGALHLRGIKNGRVMQDCGLDDLIFSVPKIVSFCSQGTTLKPGTLILTGTPAGVGHSHIPKEYLHHGDEFAVEILPAVGTLINKFEEEGITR